MTAVGGSCLCGDVAWTVSGPFELMVHCHCGRCRKAHGAAFATGLLAAADRFRLVRGRERIVRYESSAGTVRPFCGRCGSAVSEGEGRRGLVAVPAGPIDDDPGVRPSAHIFVASKGSWFDITDDLPQYAELPPG